MADIGPGQFPTDPSFETVNFRINTPTISSETSAGKIRRVGFGHSFYTFDVKYSNLTQVKLNKVNGFVATAQGPLLSFEIVLPEISTPTAPDAATANATVTTSANISYGARYVGLSNCGANKTILYAGDHFKFANHSKVYMATVDITSNGSGVANLVFAGASVTSVPSGTRVTIQNVPFTAIITNTQQEYEMGIGGISQMTLNMREVW